MYYFCQINSKTILMSSSRDQLFTLLKPKWSWAKVNAELLTKLETKSVGVSLAPTATFENLQKEGTGSQLKIMLSLDIQKSLQFDSSIGWNWHKSSNLPVISLKAEIQDSRTDHLKYQLPEGLEARIFAVKVVMHSLEREKISYLEDVGLRGSDRAEIKEGIGIFNGIRFKTTSYINEGVKFHLLVVVYFKDGKQNPEFRNIISSVISPAIFVDSRKSARDHFEKRFISFAHVFHPDLLHRQFLKKSVKDKACQFEVKVENSMEGLYNYLTAPNIRHKVKHPLFLCVKFSNVFQIMFNSKSVDFQHYPSKMQNIIFQLQKILVSEIGRRKKSERTGFQMEKPFLIGIMGQCSSCKKSKIYECLEFLNCNSIELVKYNYQIGAHFQNIFDAGDLEQVYRDSYQQLKEIVGPDGEIRGGENEHSENEQQDEGKAQEERESREKSEQRRVRLPSPEVPCEMKDSTFKLRHVELESNLSQRSPFFPNPHLDLSLLGHYSTVIQQIELQNELLGNIIRENSLIQQKIMAYCKSFNSLKLDMGLSMNMSSHQTSENYAAFSYFGPSVVNMQTNQLNYGVERVMAGVKREE